ncbi:DUF6308 family protein [Glutamicibacter protophormiae]|uniref:Uncharacterized protein n=1 Tax=Glutamicibacter protophormiae TaxID=37930 RepID=A0ABS4XQL0_GLUPR|nr:DUF6308 family protein [Glutamicibacter protophormiae]MBP2398752.1 hypothetical protein [Glutamicibacter protophormiae]GGL82219.1 hypothetical protein GCM10010038_10190 [Glutamicibacter protophormiae]
MLRNLDDNPDRLVLDYLSNELGNFETGKLTPNHLAIQHLSTYLEGNAASGHDAFVGRHFDELAVHDENPNEITASDIVAVSFLSVNVPPRAAWAFLETRKNEISEILSSIPTNLAINDPSCTFTMYDEHSALQRLWNTLRRSPSEKLWGMGPVLTSKLMARKRPHLVPIQDSIVLAELEATDRDFWQMWWEAMQLTEEEYQPVQDFARVLRASVPAAHKLSLLRVLDIVIWMNGRAPAV